MKAWEDARIVAGMRQQLRQRRELLEAGEKALGWKLAFGGPEAMKRLGTNAPLVGFLMQRAVVASGASLSLRGWMKPAAEPELAVHMGKNL
jgi:2-keto-4-pentenoate hydratase